MPATGTNYGTVIPVTFFLFGITIIGWVTYYQDTKHAEEKVGQAEIKAQRQRHQDTIAHLRRNFAPLYVERVKARKESGTKDFDYHRSGWWESNTKDGAGKRLIVVAFTNSGARVEYPHLRCRGIWTPFKEIQKGGKKVSYFLEKLETGLNNCENYSTVIVTNLDGVLKYEYMNGSSGEITHSVALNPISKSDAEMVPLAINSTRPIERDATGVDYSRIYEVRAGQWGKPIKGEYDRCITVIFPGRTTSQKDFYRHSKILKKNRTPSDRRRVTSGKIQDRFINYNKNSGGFEYIMFGGAEDSFYYIYRWIDSRLCSVVDDKLKIAGPKKFYRNNEYVPPQSALGRKSVPESEQEPTHTKPHKELVPEYKNESIQAEPDEELIPNYEPEPTQPEQDPVENNSIVGEEFIEL